jgi:predicted GNAT family acetyltransferase
MGYGLPAKRRPHYSPMDRMAILLLREARNWSLAQTAASFLVSADTISTWMKCAAESGNEGLVALREPVNKFE